MKRGINEFKIDIEFLYNTMSGGSDDYIYLWDATDDIFMVSPNMERDFSLDSGIMGQYSKFWESLINHRDIERLKNGFREALRLKKDTFNMEYQMRNASGHYIWVRNRGRIQWDENKEKPLTMAGVVHDMEHDGEIDNVTGLLSYKKGREIFEVAIEMHKYQKWGVLLVGIDGFSSINTLNNHTFGDQVLRTMVQEIQQFLHKDMHIYRFDGDQFMIIGEGLCKKEMLEVYERINQYTSALKVLEGQTYRFTLSAGLIQYPEDADTWAEVERGVSIALKHAKESGKNKCMEFTKYILKEKVKEEALSKVLSESVEKDFEGFSVMFQPICEGETLRVKGAEALLRYTTPEGRIVNPEEFIPLLEANQMIIRVGEWVLEQAVKTCKAWTGFVNGFTVNVNVSYVQLRDYEFYSKVKTILERYELSTDNLILELTETYFSSDSQNISWTLDGIRALGIQIAMDDFGTGYSSLARLSELNVDIIKIDKLFVQSLQNSKYNYDFIDSVVRLCHNTGMKVCVEGVETKEEQKKVCLLNVDYVQGFYVSRPIEESDFFEKFVLNPNATDELVIIPDNQSRQQQLVGDKDLLLSMVDGTPLALNIWNQDMKIIACNEEVLRMFDADDLDDFKLNFSKFSPEFQPDGERSMAKVEKELEKAFLGRRSSFFWMHCNKKGEPIPTEVTLVRILYQNYFVVASYTRDMREQKRMEEKVQHFTTVLQAMLDATPLCLNLWNTKFENTMCNEEAPKLFGLKSKREYIDNFNDLSPKYQPDGKLSSEKAKEKIEEALQKERIQFYWEHCDVNKEPIPSEITMVRLEELEEDGGTMIAGFTRDLRPQLALEKTEKRAVRRIQAVLDATPLTCILWNNCYEIIDCNQIAVSMFKAKDKIDVIENFYSYFPMCQPDGSNSVEKANEKFAEVKERNTCTFEWIYLNSNKEVIPCEVSMVRLPEEGIIVAYSRDLRELYQTLELNARLT